MRKLLIADTGEEFCQYLADQFRGSHRIRVCRDGNQTLETLLSFKPDVVVLDMMMPGLDGVSILEALHNSGQHPVVLAVAKWFSDYMVRAVSQYGVGYMIVKPCNMAALSARLRELVEQLKPVQVSHPDLRTVVSNLLLSLGFSTKLRGYAYLREAILEMLNNPGQSVTKVLYPAVGKCCDANKVQVERSIRSAINKAWEHRDDVMWRQYFASGSGVEMKRPTNAVFITTIADRLLMDRNMEAMCKMQKEIFEKL